MTTTYRELLNKLKIMSEEQLNSDITVLNTDDEYYKSTLVFTDERCDILDKGHPVIAIMNGSVGFGKGLT